MKFFSIKNIRERKSAGTNILDFDILLAAAIGKNREFILAHPAHRLNLWQYIKFIYFLRRLRRGCPVAYITGHKEFFNLDFFVNKHVLIPRPDTELIVDEALIEMRKIKTGNSILLIDVGTGSGCIPITISKLLQQENLTTVATDNSRRALGVARKNSRRYRVDAHFHQGNLLTPVYSFFSKPYSQIIITANLPYLTSEQFASEPSIQREPKTALISDDNNGLAIYEKLFEQINELSMANRPLLILIEIDPRQLSDARELANNYFPQSLIEIKKDLAGRDRVVKIYITN